jgi:hypothetical protein
MKVSPGVERKNSVDTAHPLYLFLDLFASLYILPCLRIFSPLHVNYPDVVESHSSVDAALAFDPLLNLKALRKVLHCSFKVTLTLINLSNIV